MKLPLRGPALAERFEVLSAWLHRWRPVWTHRPFVERPAPWEPELPGLAATLRGLSLDEAEHLHELMGGPDPACDVAPLPAYLQRAIPGRKWSQIEAFVGAVRDEPVARWVDWCSGKGHLGRTLVRTTERPGRGLERDPALCGEADRLATKVRADYRTEVCDVLEVHAELPADAGLVALHACGELHDRALARGPDVGFVAVAPCCYHRHSGERVPVRSALGRRHDLDLGPSSLRFATAEEVAAPARIRSFRRRRSAFRQGLDLLVREATGVDVYRPLGGFPTPWLQQDFAYFVRCAAEHHDLPLPARWDPDRAEAAGWAAFAEITQLSLARTVFRRPVELWFVLDRALWLEELGLEVEVRRFCQRARTPRNLLILGRAVG